MKAAVFYEHGGPSVLRYVDVAEPTPERGEALVAVRACALNGLDLYARGGGLEESIEFPHISGADIAGEVVECGPGTERVSVGARVLVNPRLYCGECRFCLRGEQSGCVDYRVFGWHRAGGYAELVAVPEENLELIPAGLSFAEAAAVPMAFTTAWRMLFSRADVGPGETVLVLGASGGVASAAVQLARLAGSRVLAATSSEKVDRVRKLGADAVIDYATESLTARVKDLTDGQGVDVLVQTQGGVTWQEGLDCMGRFGRIVVCAAIQGAAPTEDLGAIWWKQLTIVGSTGGTPSDFRHVVTQLRAGTIKPVVSEIYALSEAAEAQIAFANHAHVGKVVLQP